MFALGGSVKGDCVDKEKLNESVELDESDKTGLLDDEKNLDEELKSVMEEAKKP